MMNLFGRSAPCLSCTRRSASNIATSPRCSKKNGTHLEANERIARPLPYGTRSPEPATRVGRPVGRRTIGGGLHVSPARTTRRHVHRAKSRQACPLAHVARSAPSSSQCRFLLNPPFEPSPACCDTNTAEATDRDGQKETPDPPDRGFASWRFPLFGTDGPAAPAKATGHCRRRRRSLSASRSRWSTCCR